MTAQIIQKEQLSLCHFTASDVLRGDWEKMYRVFSLQRAERVGKHHGNRVRISFRLSGNEMRMVKAVVSSVNDQFVFLAGGYSIPLQAILGVEF